MIPSIRSILLVSATLWVLSTTFAIAQAPAPPAAAPVAPAAAPAVTPPAATSIPMPPSAATLNVLKALDARGSQIKAVEVSFDQVKVSQQFLEETRSSGHLMIQMPDKLRCEYANPDPSTIIFANDTFYQYAPTIKQVDKFRFSSPAEARDRLRLLMLGFGVSTQEVLKSYNVELLRKAGDESKDTDPEGYLLSFKPINPLIARDYREIRVWFTKSLRPEKVRLLEVSGDSTTLTIRKFVEQDAIKAKEFELNFPKDVEVVEHEPETEAAPQK
jgi:outer membrane lipoprotein-sorting protein